jgi:putative DNA primase/helicase
LLTGPFGDDLRLSTSCHVTDVPGTSHLPAMLALIRQPDGKPVLVHRTYLGPDGKADITSPRRMMAGTIPKGSAIRLAPYTCRLGIAEGIETALAVTRDFTIPCWSACNADMLAGFAWPDDVTELHIFGDNDLKYGGQAAAFALAHRVATHRHAPAVQVHIPPTPGDDWLDHGNRALTALRAA